MRALETLLAQPLVAALGWALLHFLWQGTVVTLLLASVLRILRQRSANARYIVACAALLLMAVLPLVTMVRISLTTSGRTSNEPTSAFIADAVLQPATSQINSTVASTSTATATTWQWSADWSEMLVPLLSWTILFWLLGVAFFSLRLAGGWLYTRRLKLRGVRALEEKWQQLFQRLCRELCVTRPVQFLESTLVAVPTAIGWLRPIILLPIGTLTGLSLQQLEAIIAHELAHIRRHDYLINLLQAVIETLLFYHPGVWWVSRRIRQEREHCCDDLAVAVCGDALTYARALFEMEQLRAAAPQLALAANGGLLMNRIERLVGVQTPPNHRFAGLLACLIVLTTVVSVGAQILLPRSPQMAAVPQPETTTAMSHNRAAQANTTQTLRSTQDERAAEALLQTLQNPSWQVRKVAAETLAHLNISRATELLTVALRDVHPQVREQAVIGLGDRNDNRAIESLLAALTDHDWTVREQAAIALGKRKDERIIDPLLRALLDSEWQVREQAVRSLGAIEAKLSVEPLIYALRDEHEQVREAAAKSLGWLDDQRAQEPLTQALQDTSEQVRKKAAEALGLLKSNGNEPSTIRKSGQVDLPVREEIKKRYLLSAAARVEVSYILGSVEIEATDSSEAEVEIVRSANAQADLDRFDRIIIEQTPAHLVLRGEDSKSNGIEIRHHVRLRLPRSSQLSLREINGRVSINGLEGTIRLNEVNGGAVIPHLSGELEMSGINGGIKLGIARLAPNGIRLRDITSGIELRIADGVNAELQIGELDDAPLIETARVSLNRIGEDKFEGRIGVGGPVIRIVDVNGQVRIRNA